MPPPKAKVRENIGLKRCRHPHHSKWNHKSTELHRVQRISLKTRTELVRKGFTTLKQVHSQNGYICEQCFNHISPESALADHNYAMLSRPSTTSTTLFETLPDDLELSVSTVEISDTENPSSLITESTVDLEFCVSTVITHIRNKEIPTVRFYLFV